MLYSYLLFTHKSTRNHEENFTLHSYNLYILSAGEIADQYSAAAEKIIQAALESDEGFERLAELCDTFGPRFTGSQI
jgi:hypothetical protein